MDSQGPGKTYLSMFLYVIGSLIIFSGILIFLIFLSNFLIYQAMLFVSLVCLIGVVLFSLGRVLDNQYNLLSQLDRLEKQLENKKIE